VDVKHNVSVVQPLNRISERVDKFHGQRKQRRE
jgi:hypothetical protein